MRLLGQLEQGVYIDDLEDVPEEELAEFYGVDEPEQYRGHLEDEDEDFPNHEPAGDDGHADGDPAPNVPEAHYPFPNDEIENLFHQAFNTVCEEEIIPAGYNILPNEWGEDGYPSIEVLRVGRRGRREITVGLADEIWRPRAILWVQAVEVITRVLDLVPINL